MSEKTKSIIERYIIPVLLTAALIITAFWAAGQKRQAEKYKTAAEAVYIQSHGELTDDLYDLESTLTKLMAVNSPAQYVLLLDEVWRLSGSAVSNMSHLPLSHVDTAEMNQFVVRLGDYAHALTAKTVRGGIITPEDGRTIAALRDSCGKLAREYGERHAAGDIPMSYEPESYFSESAPKNPDDTSPFPTLIYDGPFSESSEKAAPRGLIGGEISQAQAEAAAEAAAGRDMEFSGLGEGKIPVYSFSAASEDGSWAEAAVTRRGGYLLWYMSSCSGEQWGRPPKEEAGRYADEAVKRLEEMGYEGMKPTYAQYYGGAALINCAATQDGTMLYSDLVKVWVDRETLRVCGIDAQNYIFSHVKREIPRPLISEAEAEELLSPSLTVQDRNLALIPVTKETERLCYEFKCNIGEDSYIVYINALNGEEEQIFRIIDSEDGDLVI